MKKNLPRDIKISIMKFLDKASIRILSVLYRSFYILVKDRDFMINNKFDDEIISASITNLTIESDNLELFKLYAKYNKYYVTQILAKYGAIKILRYVHELDCAWHVDTCKIAATYDKLDCLRYAHENGCPWTTETCSEAAKYGH